jgi:AcrR family transcriptional regulator
MASNTRQRILEATWALLRRDPTGTRVEDIAAAAKITRQALYRHFPDRGRLFVATARYIDEQLGLDEAVRPLYQARDLDELLDRFAAFLGDYHPKVYEIARRLEAVRHTDEAVAAAYEDRRRQRWRGSRELVRTIARAGRLAPGLTVDDAAGLVMAIGGLSFWEELCRGCGWSTRRFVAHTSRLLRTSLLAVTARRK